MNISAALQALGLGPTATFEDMRSAYRDLLMRHHPDHQLDSSVDSGTDSPAERTAEIVAAFQALREATADGTRPLSGSDLVLSSNERYPVVLIASPGDVFARLLLALEEIGEISFIDRESEILGATISIDGFAASQLTAEVDRSGVDPHVQFTLEPLGTGTPPDLAVVVQRLAPYL